MKAEHEWRIEQRTLSQANLETTRISVTLLECARLYIFISCDFLSYSRSQPCSNDNKSFARINQTIFLQSYFHDQNLLNNARVKPA